jgi:hypothetical protein
VRTGTKQTTRSVRQPMTNARPAQHTRRVKIARRKTTPVIVPMAGWQHPGPLFVKHAGQQAQLKRVLTSAGHRARPVSIGIHAAGCPLSIFVLPMFSDVDDFEALNECVRERDDRCDCVPIVMYTGAKA